jgi:DNA-binding beta-propeller fold protein YncE
LTGKSYTADLKITPDGKHLYGTNRGHDSLASYRTAADGTLTLLTIQPSGGKGPQNLLITPNGRWLLCANMPGNNVVVVSHAEGRFEVPWPRDSLDGVTYRRARSSITAPSLAKQWPQGEPFSRSPVMAFVNKAPQLMN